MRDEPIGSTVSECSK